MGLCPEQAAQGSGLGKSMPDNNMVMIDRLSMDEGKETLGVYTCLSGNTEAHLKAM